jgi:hypothetical protein
MGFNERKTTQAAAELLNLAKERMPVSHLITLLYLVDREALLRWSRPVTGDTYSSTQFGPVLDHVSKLLRSRNPEGFWRQFISPPFDSDVILWHQPGHDELSEAEEALIYEMHRKSHEPDWLHPSHLSSLFPEWYATDEGQPISYTDILRTDGRSPEEIEAIERDIAEVNLVHTLFAAS